MHVESHHGHVRNIREFLGQYFMIVISIITAMGFEQAARAYHNRELANASRERIKAEISFNLEELKSSLEANRTNLKSLKSYYDQQVAGIIAAKAEHRPIVPVSLEPAVFQINAPSLRRDAWEASIADQSATHLAVADLQKYSEIYSAQKDVGQFIAGLIQSNWQTDAADLVVATSLGRMDVEAQVHIYARAIVILSVLNQNLAQLEAKLTPIAKGEHAN
jgi:hypothetical protein